MRFSSKREDVDWEYVGWKQGEVERGCNIGVGWVGGNEERGKEERSKERGKGQDFGGRDDAMDKNKNQILHVDEDYYAQMHLQRINSGK